MMQPGKLEGLRGEYPVFSYESFAIQRSGSSLRLQFDYRLPPDLNFSTQTILEHAPETSDRIPLQVLENLVFHLGLIESFSYWKATCSPSFVINAGSLDNEQIAWWKDLLLHGMREFFYVNRIDFTSEEFVTLIASHDSTLAGWDGQLANRSLLPIGGGRDSAFTARVFQQAGKPFGCMVLNPTPASRRVASAVGCAEPVVIERTLDPRLLKLNQEGYLNGHTPFSAMLAFLGGLCLAVYDHSRIVIANERSSDEANTVFLGKKINHQYSKSFAFEERFDRYQQKYLLKNARYFSFIRPLYELQVGRAFARYPEMFSAIRSCNRNQRSDSWCGACAKCLSVFITSYPFVSQTDLIRMFGSDFFQTEGSIPIIRQLAGLDEHKPFECVTTFDETVASLYLCIVRCEKEGRPLPIALRYARESILPPDQKVASIASRLLSNDDTRHRIPAEFEKLVLAAVQE
jgi:UDP-N-acetyl-alpha-D-muramoyl-L-alanyl-L-glutamate epimerase